MRLWLLQVQTGVIWGLNSFAQLTCLFWGNPRLNQYARIYQWIRSGYHYTMNKMEQGWGILILPCVLYTVKVVSLITVYCVYDGSFFTYNVFSLSETRRLQIIAAVFWSAFAAVQTNTCRQIKGLKVLWSTFARTWPTNHLQTLFQTGCNICIRSDG